MIGWYVPGASWLHRAPAWAKLLWLAASGTAVMLLPWIPVAGLVGLILIGFAIARLPWRVLWRLRLVLAFVVVIAAVQWWFATPVLGVTVGLRILYLVLTATLTTATTRTTDLVATLEALLAPLARFGVRGDRVALGVSLVLRFIPVLAEQRRAVREAQAARGVRAPHLYLVPLIIRTLRLADGVGEALEVRGWEER